MIKVVNEGINDGKELFFIRYSYEGDSVSDFESVIICVANSEDEALDIAKKYCSDGYNFSIDKSRTGKYSSIEQWYKKFPMSNMRIYNANGITDLGERFKRGLRR